jgi:hypothetical protein
VGDLAVEPHIVQRIKQDKGYTGGELYLFDSKQGVTELALAFISWHLGASVIEGICLEAYSATTQIHLSSNL